MRLPGRNAPPDDGGFTLVLSLLLIVIVAGLSLAMGAVILTQQQPTQEARKRVTTINAAQSGLQVALLNIRLANDSANKGDITKIPCTNKGNGQGDATFTATDPVQSEQAAGATFEGSVTAATDPTKPTYRVSIAYYTFNPAGLRPPDLRLRAMPCRPGQGGVGSVPAFAYLQSSGTGAQIPGNTAAQGNRTQSATYQFTTTNINIVGGRLRSYGTQECLDAGPGGTPPGNVAVGTTLTMQPCLAIGTARQTWQYRQDLTIFYGGDTSLNLCIQAPAAGSPGGTLPTLQKCTGSGSGATYPYAPGQQVQEWGFNDNGHFAAALGNGTVTNGTDGPCLQPSGAGGSTAAASGAVVVYVNCDNNTTGPAAFDPDPEVGAGKAGGAISGVPGGTRQYVNYAQFGRCLDITGQNVNADHLIAYPCKQAPDSRALTFNQVWDYTAGTDGYGTFYVTLAGGRYCLTAPLTGELIVTKSCLANPLPDQLWRATKVVPGDYAGSYTLINKGTGTCMGVSALSQAISNQASNIILSACNGSNGQKWNAPPDAVKNPLANVIEQNGG